MLTHLASPQNHLRTTTQSEQSYLKQFLTNQKQQQYRLNNFHVDNQNQTKPGSLNRNQMVSCSPSIVSSDKFKEIQEILNRQNSNLKQHRDFLLCEVRRYNETLNKYKMKMKEYKRKIQQLEHQKDVYKMQCVQMKEYVFKGIGRMEHIVHNNNQSATLKNIGKQQLNHQFYEHSFRPTLQPQQTSSNIRISEDIQQQSSNNHLEDLNDKFEALMYQYRTTKSHQSRRKCIQLAKEIKNIKFKLNHSQGVVKQHSLGNSSVGGRMSQQKNKTTLKFINTNNSPIIPLSPNSFQDKYKMPPKLVKNNSDQHQQLPLNRNLIEGYNLRKTFNITGEEINKKPKQQYFGKYIKDKMTK